MERAYISRPKAYLFRRSLASTVAMLLALSPLSPAYSLPSGGTVTAGTATIGANVGGTKTIDQTSDRAIIDWTSFNTGIGETVTFNQPSSNAIILNRVTNSGVRTIYRGALNANGNVYIVNPDGVYFSGTSTVNVNSLIATNSNISDSDFMNNAGTAADPFKFTDYTSGTGAGVKVQNLGAITVADGGYVALVGPVVTNSGTITANFGKILLASGSNYTINFDGTGLINFLMVGVVNVDYGPGDFLVNTGTLQAEGGLIKLTTDQIGTVLSKAISSTGTMDVSSATQEGGDIIISGFNYARNGFSGTYDASGTTGGTITIEEANDINTDSALNTVMDVSGTVGDAGAVTWDNQDSSATGTSMRLYGPTTIQANGGTDGDGGTVTLNGKEQFFVYGAIEAKGGSNSGNGGTISLNAASSLSPFTSDLDVSAVNGQNGIININKDNGLYFSDSLITSAYIESWMATARQINLTSDYVRIDTDITIPTGNKLNITTPYLDLYAAINQIDANSLMGDVDYTYVTNIRHSNDATRDNPLLQNALDMVATGGTIELERSYAGGFDSGKTFTIDTDGVTIKGYNADSAASSSSRSTATLLKNIQFIVDADNVTFNGLELTQDSAITSSSGVNGLGVKNSYFESLNHLGTDTAITLQNGNSNSLLYQNTFKSFATGVNATNSTGLTLSGNLFTGNDVGVQLSGSSTGSATFTSNNFVGTTSFYIKNQTPASHNINGNTFDGITTSNSMTNAQITAIENKILQIFDNLSYGELKFADRNLTESLLPKNVAQLNNQIANVGQGQGQGQSNNPNNENFSSSNRFLSLNSYRKRDLLDLRFLREIDSDFQIFDNDADRNDKDKNIFVDPQASLTKFGKNKRLAKLKNSNGLPNHMNHDIAAKASLSPFFNIGMDNYSTLIEFNPSSYSIPSKH